MEQVLFLVIAVAVIIILTIGMIFLFVNIRKAKVSHRKKWIPVIAVIIDILCLIGAILFTISHKTFYKYNDWKIKAQSINTVYEQYGDFDIGNVEENKAGEAGYYIYTNENPLAKDHLPHYYFIKYDERGEIYAVYESSVFDRQ